ALLAARERHEQARATLAALDRRVIAGLAQLRRARDPLVPSGAPELPEDSLLTGWTRLQEWAAAQAEALRTVVADAQDDVRAAQESAERLTRALADDLAGHGLAVPAEE